MGENIEEVIPKNAQSADAVIERECQSRDETGVELVKDGFPITQVFDDGIIDDDRVVIKVKTGI